MCTSIVRTNTEIAGCFQHCTCAHLKCSILLVLGRVLPYFLILMNIKLVGNRMWTSVLRHWRAIGSRKRCTQFLNSVEFKSFANQAFLAEIVCLCPSICDDKDDALRALKSNEKGLKKYFPLYFKPTIWVLYIFILYYYMYQVYVLEPKWRRLRQVNG